MQRSDWMPLLDIKENIRWSFVKNCWINNANPAVTTLNALYIHRVVPPAHTHTSCVLRLVAPSAVGFTLSLVDWLWTTGLNTRQLSFTGLNTHQLTFTDQQQCQAFSSETVKANAFKIQEGRNL